MEGDNGKRRCSQDGSPRRRRADPLVGDFPYLGKRVVGTSGRQDANYQ